MTDFITRMDVRQADHDAIARDVEAWLAADPKNKIERLRGFEMAEATWTPRQTVQSVTSANTAAEKEKREAARKAAEADRQRREALLAEKPIGVRPRREPLVKVKSPDDKRKPCRPGTKTGELVELLKAKGPMTVAMIVAELDWDRPPTYARLDSLQAQGLVRCIGILRRPGVKPAQGYEAVPGCP